MVIPNDIYDSKGKWEKLLKNIEVYLTPPKGLRKYKIKNPANLQHFLRLVIVFDAKETSYVRRLRLFRNFLVMAHATKKDLASITKQEDVNKILAFANKQFNSPKTVRDFRIDLKYLWKALFPEKDDKGRINANKFPYPVEHITGKLDKSREKDTNDRITMDEFMRLLQSFEDDPRMQCLIYMAFETLARPQELLYLQIKDVQLFDNYSRISVSSHGKEGTKVLQLIDGDIYLRRWLGVHPDRSNQEAFLFLNLGNRNKFQQLRPHTVSKAIKSKFRALGISKRQTLYSLKRNGVSFLVLQGKSEVAIQHRAGWNSTRQLKTYDKTTALDTYKQELIERGLLPGEKSEIAQLPKAKKCSFCDEVNSPSDTICGNCKRPLDRQQIEKEARVQDERIRILEERTAKMLDLFDDPRFQKVVKTAYLLNKLK